VRGQGLTGDYEALGRLHRWSDHGQVEGGSGLSGDIGVVGGVREGQANSECCGGDGV
jgi:hypothetical protein